MHNTSHISLYIPYSYIVALVLNDGCFTFAQPASRRAVTSRAIAHVAQTDVLQVSLSPSLSLFHSTLVEKYVCETEMVNEK